MARTYDPALNTTKDWVRNLIGDTDVPDNAILSDEEINAMVTEVEANRGTGVHVKYCSAALAATALAAVAVSQAPEILTKTVGRLSLRRQSGTDLRRAYADHIKTLEARCSEMMPNRPRVVESVAKARILTSRSNVR